MMKYEVTAEAFVNQTHRLSVIIIITITAYHCSLFSVYETVKLVLIYRPRRDGRLSWPWVAGWLHTEINVRHRELNPDTVTHLRTNRARR